MIGQDITEAKRLLEEGKIIALPTETLYGLAVHPFHLPALHRLFAVKKRPLTKALVLQTYSLAKVTDLVKSIPEKARLLAQAFWPGPLTLILEKSPSLPSLLTAGKSTVGIRIPRHPLTLSLLQHLSFPLAVTSANLSGEPATLTPQAVRKELGSSIAYILDGGPSPLGIASTIIRIHLNTPILYRAGFIPQSAIEKLVGKVQVAPPV